MILSNLHTHTTFSDGIDTPEEMAQRAVELGFCSLGFSDHSETLCDPDYCMAKKDYPLYRKAIGEIKKKYEGKLEILCGIEQDQLSEIDPSEYDYVIGAVHYVSVKGKIHSVDHSPETQRNAIEACGGDPIELAKRYYDLVVENSFRNDFLIQAHFDLITKFGFFDDLGEPYEAVAREALFEVAKRIPYFEMNTGAIARGRRTTPYPESFLLKALHGLGAKIVLGSDCHDRNYLDCHFKESAALLKEIGFSSLYRLRSGGMEEVKIDEE